MMNIEEVREICLALPQVEESTPFAAFGSDDVVFKVGGRMFALLRVDDSRMVALKCDPDLAAELRDALPETVEPAYHFNKKYWNQVHYDHGAVTEAWMRQWVRHAYDEAVKKLTRKVRAELGL